MLLLEVEKMSQLYELMDRSAPLIRQTHGCVDSFGLFIHPVNVFEMHLDDLVLLSKALSNLGLLLVIAWMLSFKLLQKCICHVVQDRRLVLEDHGNHVELVSDILRFRQQCSLFAYVEKSVDKGRIPCSFAIIGRRI